MKSNRLNLYHIQETQEPTKMLPDFILFSKPIEDFMDQTIRQISKSLNQFQLLNQGNTES